MGVVVCSQWKFHKVALEMLLLLVRYDVRLPTSAVHLFVSNVNNSTINVRKVTTLKYLSPESWAHVIKFLVFDFPSSKSRSDKIQIKSLSGLRVSC